MEKIRLEDFLSFTYLSMLKDTEDGVFFVAAKAKKDRSGYERNIWKLGEDGPVELTHDGKAGAYTVHGGKIYFTARRTEEERKEEGVTNLYALPVGGGEAYPWRKLEGDYSSFSFVSDDAFFALESVDLRTEGMGAEERKRKAKELRDYEDITESGFYLNGGGWINNRRRRLVFFNKGKKTTVFPDGFSTASLSFSPDRKRLYVTGETRRDPRPSFTSEVRVVDTATLLWSTILPQGETGVSGVFEIGGRVVAFTSDYSRYGLNQNCDISIIRDGHAHLWKKWGEAIYSSVGSDVRLGGGASWALDGDALYFTTTLGHSSYVYRLTSEGSLERAAGDGGSVDAISVRNGRILYIGLSGQKLQEIYDGKGKRLTAFNTRCLRRKYVAVPEEVEIVNDGVPLKGWVLRPFGYEEGRKYPAILSIHGGPKTVYGTVYMHEMQYWAGHGYFVFWTNPRGSDGRGDAFADIRGKYGTVDYSDLMAFTDAVLASYPDIDRERLGATGGSYGGFMSNWILGHTDRFKAIATQRSIYNWVSFWGTSDIGPFFAKDQCGAGIENPEALWHRSPMEAIIKNAKTPTLIIHSDKDYRCPVSEGYQLYSALVEMGVESKLMLFHEETHELSRSGKPSNRIKRLEEITKWMDRYLEL